MSVKDKVINIVAEHFSIKPEEVCVATTPKELGADSLDEMEIVMAIEEGFDIHIESYEAEKFTDVQSIIDFVLDKNPPKKSKVIKGSPFDLAGYTEETKFRVIKDYGNLRVGDIVTLKEDDYSDCPGFCTEDGRVEYMKLPPEYDQELEVYEEPNEDKEALNKLKDEIEAVHKNKKPFVELCNYPKDHICSTDKQKLSLLARIIVSEGDLFNGHSQVTINSKLTLDDLTELMTEVNEYFKREGIVSYTQARFDVEGNGSLYAVGYWNEGEHPLGHTDKLLLGWGE